MLIFMALNKGGVGAEQQDFFNNKKRCCIQKHQPKHMNSAFITEKQLLVTQTTTNLQPTTPAEHKTQKSAQSIGCGCTKAFFTTTSKQKEVLWF